MSDSDNAAAVDWRPSLIEQISLLDKIRKKVIRNSKTLNMDIRSSECGNIRCIEGWAIELSEKDTGLDVTLAAHALLPDFAKLFSGTTEQIMDWLLGRCYGLVTGDVAKVGSQWIDRDCNTYDGNASYEAVKSQAITNTGCTFCKSCIDCTDCESCIGCNGCVECDKCIRCTDCVACKACLDCRGCENEDQLSGTDFGTSADNFCAS